MELKVFILVILTGVARVESACQIKRQLRGVWLLLDNKLKSTSDTISVTRSGLRISADDNTYRYECLISHGYNLILKSKDNDGFLCLDFAQTYDTSAQYSLLRRSPLKGSFFEPSTIEQCLDLAVDKTVQIRRTDPGCSFARLLQGAWAFNDDFFNQIKIEPYKVTMKAYAKFKLPFSCERYQFDEDGNVHMYIVRANRIRDGKDAVLCLKFHVLPMTIGNRNMLLGQRLNEGPFKIVDHQQPVYLHETCDYVDGSGGRTRGLFLFPKKGS